MRRLFHWLLHELRSAVPAALYFFVGFQLVALTDALILEQYGVEVATFMLATVAALIAAKVVLVLDALPRLNLDPRLPPALNIAWKTLLFLSLVGAFKYVEEILPLLLHAGAGLASAHRQLMAEVPWHRVLAAAIWLTVLFAGFSTVREIGRAIGREKLLAVLFGSVAAGDADRR